MRPRPGKAAQLRTGLLALVAPTRAEAGCVNYDVYEEADGGLILVETWRSQAGLEAHQQQPAVRAFFDVKLPDLLEDEMDVHSSTLRSSASTPTS
jgi:quinol monooxygenase YgiN